MSMPLFHSLFTIVLMAIFIGITVWAYSSRREQDFDDASRLPLDDDIQTTNGDQP